MISAIKDLECFSSICLVSFWYIESFPIVGSQYFQHASSCKRSVYLHRNYFVWVLSRYGLQCFDDGRFNITLGRSIERNFRYAYNMAIFDVYVKVLILILRMWAKYHTNLSFTFIFRSIGGNARRFRLSSIFGREASVILRKSRTS